MPAEKGRTRISGTTAPSVKSSFHRQDAWQIVRLGQLTFEAVDEQSQHGVCVWDGVEVKKFLLTSFSNTGLASTTCFHLFQIDSRNTADASGPAIV